MNLNVSGDTFYKDVTINKHFNQKLIKQICFIYNNNTSGIEFFSTVNKTLYSVPPILASSFIAFNCTS